MDQKIEHQLLSEPRGSSRFLSWSLVKTSCVYLLAAVLLVQCIFHSLAFVEHLQDSRHGHLFTYKHRATRLLTQHPLVDGHNDLAILVAAYYGDQIESGNFTRQFEGGNLKGQVDIPRLQDGKYGGAFWSVFWPCPEDPEDFSQAAYGPIVRNTLEQIDLMHRLSAKYPKYFTIPTSAVAGLENFYNGQLISPLGLEGLHQIGQSYATLRNYYSLGVRYSTLTWNCHNAYADSALTSYPPDKTSKAVPLHGGISAEGRTMIREMNRLGMIVDLSHVSQDTMRDVLVGKHNDKYPLVDSDGKPLPGNWSGSIAVPIFSHSSAYALCPHPRNVPDDILELVKKRNSIVMVNISPDFISCHYPKDSDPDSDLPTTDEEGATLERVADHIEYIGKKIGWAHVGIGTDFDGIETTPKGLDGVDKLVNLIAELLRRGVKEKDAALLAGGNILRVWHDVEAVSKRLRAEGVRPAEDDIRKLIQR